MVQADNPVKNTLILLPLAWCHAASMNFYSSLLAFSIFAIGTFAGCSASERTGQDVDAGVSDAATPLGDSGETGADARAATAHIVEVNNFTYKPASLTIKAGDTVTWKFVKGTHSVTSGTGCKSDGKVDSKVHDSPFEFSHTFLEPGRFDYFCDYMKHCTEYEQIGVITIE